MVTYAIKINGLYYKETIRECDGTIRKMHSDPFNHYVSKGLILTEKPTEFTTVSMPNQVKLILGFIKRNELDADKIEIEVIK